MQFAVNYSLAAAELLQQDRIPLDRFKFPNWPDTIATLHPQRPLYVHFDLQAGSGTLATRVAADGEQIARLREATHTPFVNLHLAPKVEHFPTIPADTTDPAHSAAITDRLIADTASVVERFGAEHVIAETIYKTAVSQTLRPAIDPAVIQAVFAATGCGLLLDLAHARLAARYLGMDARAYIESLPVERLREVHVTGIDLVDGIPADHFPMTEEDWPLLEWALGNIARGAWGRPWAVVFEYGGIGAGFTERTDPAVLAEQVPRLYTLVHATANVLGGHSLGGGLAG